MASCLNDKARLEHYDKCRFRKKRLEKILDWCMWAAIFFGACTVVPELFVNGFMNIIFLQDVEMLLPALAKTLSVAAAIYAIYYRKWPVTVAATLVVSWCNGAVALATAISAVAHYGLNQLEKEPGWPLFEITYEEQEQREKNLDNIFRNRAVELGARVATEPDGDTDMHDILDESTDKVYVRPKGYHDRFRDAEPEDRIHSFEPGVMDTLESIGEEE